MPSYWEGVSSNNNSTSGSDEHIKTDPTVPAGYYVCEIIDFGAWFKTELGFWNAKWAMKIIEGVQRDKYLVRWSMMNEEKASKNFDLFQNTLGELPDFNPDAGFVDLPNIRHRMVGAIVKVKCAPWTYEGKTGMTVYINQLVSLGDVQDASVPTPAEVHSEDPDTGDDDDDQIPF
jgi:hypothetical protein|tara:strand:+ start:2389 stop:2913 length:525 start_codon:yes stop_codon:yes gene_type:complete